MKYKLIIVQLVFFWTGLAAQELHEIALPIESPGWIEFRSDFKTLPSETFVKHKSAFGLSTKDEMVLLRKEIDDLGFTHFRFQQRHQGLKVEGAEYILHSKNNKALKGNGIIFSNLQMNTQAVVDKEDVIELAKRFMNAKVYMWEDRESEQFLKTTKGDKTATYFPDPELVVLPLKSKVGEYESLNLAYRIELYSKIPFDGKAIYINAWSGDILLETPLHINCVSGEGCTLYNGPSLKEIDTDVEGSEFRLFDDCRGDGIHTRAFAGSAEIVDDDNIWTGAAQCPGVSAHWGLERTYDYYIEKHSRDSYDNEGAVINSFIESNGFGLDNAFWSSGLQTINFGNGGGGLTYDDLVSLDIAGHEFTHAVTQFSANLIYAGESGGLNESFSDIFGTAIEYYEDEASANYLIGEDVWVMDGYLRNMSNPKAKTGTASNAPSPDTYLGEFWTADIDPHFGSGVQNFWFYLLSEGSEGTDGINDNGDVFSLCGIGMESAAAIAYRNLTVYLTSSSGYAEAREGSIQAAIDLFGECSLEAMEVAAAWDAVGVYDYSQCPKYHTIPDLPISSEEYQAQCCISSTGLVQWGSSVQMHAGTNVYLKPGFTADLGADFHAFIEGCTKSGNLVAPQNGILSVSSDAIQTKELGEQKELLTIKNYPNPSAGFMNFGFELASTFSVHLEVFDLAGHLVATPIKNREFESGVHVISFDGQYLDEGIYFYRFTTNQEIITQKMIVSR